MGGALRSGVTRAQRERRRTWPRPSRRWPGPLTWRAWRMPSNLWSRRSGGSRACPWSSGRPRTAGRDRGVPVRSGRPDPPLPPARSERVGERSWGRSRPGPGTPPCVAAGSQALAEARAGAPSAAEFHVRQAAPSPTPPISC